MTTKLNLDKKKIDRCRQYAKEIAADLQKVIAEHTTVSIERAVLRLWGIDGVNELGVPLPNVVVEILEKNRLLHYGAATVIAYMMASTGNDMHTVIAQLTQGQLQPTFDTSFSSEKIHTIMAQLSAYGNKRIEQTRLTRQQWLTKYPMKRCPWLYAIVATGDIHEDTKQAQSACLNGADCIAVIRSTAQSLMDYVPYGATTKGFGGTYATQENFKIMRKALDEIIPHVGHYVYLVNYCSGLCMSEIAAMGALERLDMMLNDAMYGIIFRDINMVRTFVDQHFSRMINARAAIVINTGEDNYLTTADAVEQAHTVPVSDFINEQLALNAGMQKEFLGLGHAFEINPALKNSFLFEIASAQLVRELFPDSPIKYMPPTKHIDGNIFRAHAIDTMFNTASSATGQSIHLTGILTEGIHTPFLHDRFLSLESARYVMNATADLYEEIEFKQDGIIQKRAQHILDQALHMLEEIKHIGLVTAIERGYFADIKRTQHQGKGAEGIVEKAPQYCNPFADEWQREQQEK